VCAAGAQLPEVHEDAFAGGAAGRFSHGSLGLGEEPDDQVELIGGRLGGLWDREEPLRVWPGAAQAAWFVGECLTGARGSATLAERFASGLPE